MRSRMKVSGIVVVYGLVVYDWMGLTIFEGNQVRIDEKWQWGRLGDGGERFVVYHEHVFPGLYNVSV